MKRILISLIAVSAVVSTLLAGGTSFAAGNASFSLSPASGTYAKNAAFSVRVSETGDNVNVVTAKLRYDASKLRCDKVEAATDFENGISATCSNGNVTISRYTGMDAEGNPTTISGNHAVGTIFFTALANAGTTDVSFLASSQIAANGANAWNGNTAGGTYTLVDPSTGGQGGGVVTPPATTSTPNNVSGSNRTAPAGTTPTNTTTQEVAAATTEQPVVEEDDVATSTGQAAQTATIVEKPASRAWLWILAGLVAVAAGIVGLRKVRGGTPAVLATVPATTNKKSNKKGKN